MQKIISITITSQGFRKFIKWLLVILFFLFIMHLLVSITGHITRRYSMLGFLDLFAFNSETNFPTYFSSFILLTASIVLFLIYKFHKRNASNESKYWITLSIIFLYLSLDEFIVIHERYSKALQVFFDADGIFLFAWVIPALVIFIVFALYFIKFFLRLQKRYKILFFLSAFLLVGGAIGFEMIEGLIGSASEYTDPFTENGMIWSWFAAITIQEVMEMSGVILFLYSLSEYIDGNIQNISFQIGN